MKWDWADLEMWKYIKGAKPPPPKKAKLTDEDKRAYDKKYDATKRTRSFLPKWKEGRDWLHYDDEKNEMFCSICRSEKFTD